MSATAFGGIGSLTITNGGKVTSKSSSTLLGNYGWLHWYGAYRWRWLDMDQTRGALCRQLRHGHDQPHQRWQAQRQLIRQLSGQ